MRVSTPEIESILSRMRVPDEEGLFVIGCFERPATVYMQQVRALNLIYALNSAGQSPKTSVAIVGAGAAGLTAAAASAMHGWQVTVLDQITNDVLSLAGSDASKRWLHPHIYDWPAENKDAANAGLCVLDWTAGPADHVISELRLRWKEIESAYPVETHLGVTDVSVQALETKYFVQWNGEGHGVPASVSQPWGARPGRRLRGKRFDLVILAVGFGEEEKSTDFPNVFSYWANDDIDKNRKGSSRPQIVLVSGTGDGGLIDALRFSFTNFKHEDILRQLRNEWLVPEEFERVQGCLRQIESDARAAKASSKLYYEAQLNCAYRTLVDSLELKSDIAMREDVKVVLTGASPYPLTLESAPINRFLFSLTNALYFPGPITKVTGNSENSTWGVRFERRQESISFDTVVIRHGPKSALKRGFPDIHARCCPLEKIARTTPDPTREPMYDDTFASVLTARSAALAFPYRRSDVSDIRDTVMGAQANVGQAASFERYRILLAEHFATKASFVLPKLSRLAGGPLLSTDAQAATSTQRQESIDADWLASGAAVRVILGAPGTGKTTVLHFLVSQAAQDAHVFPLYVQTRRLRLAATSHFFESAFDWCVALLELHDSSELEALRAVYLGRLLQGRVIAFLDGVDEIRPDEHAELIRLLEEASGSFRRGNRLVLTSRSKADLGSIPGCELFELMPPGPRQMLELLSRRSPGGEGAQEVIAAMAAIPNVGGLLQSPQVFELFLQFFTNAPVESQNTYDLINSLIPAFFPGATGAPTHLALSELALAIFPGALFTEQEVAAAIANVADRIDVDVLVERALASPILVAMEGQPNLHSFAHRTLQECLAAQALGRHLSNASVGAKVFDPLLSESEILPMAIGLLANPTEAFKLLETLPDSLDYTVLRLRARAARYRGRPSREQAERLADDVRKVVANLELGSNDVLRQLSQAVLGMRRDVVSAVKFRLAPLLQDSEPILRCRALEFFAAAQLPDACTAIAPSLSAKDEGVTNTAAKALGELGDVAAIPLLVHAFLTNEGLMVFAAAGDAIERIGGEQAVTAFVKILADQSLFRNFRWPAAQALGRLRDPVALRALLDAISDSAEVVRVHVAKALGQFSDPRALEAVRSCLVDPEVSVRIAAAEALGTMGDTSAVVDLLEALKDWRSPVKSSAARALFKIAPSDLLESLRRIVADTENTWRGHAAELLGEVLGTEALPTLLLLSQDPDTDLRLGATKGLGQVSDARSVARLLELADDASEDVRYSAVEGLGRLSDSSAVSAIIKRLVADGENKVGIAAAQALDRIADPSSLDALMRAIEGGGLTSTFAAFALANIGPETAIPVLASAWQIHPADRLNIRIEFLIAIGRIDGPKAASTLRELFSGEGEEARSDVIQAYREMKHPAAVPGLLAGLSDESALVRRWARSALHPLSHSQMVAGILLALRDSHAGVRRQAVLICPFYADAQIAEVLENIDRAGLDTEGVRELDSTLEAVRIKRLLCAEISAGS